MGADSWGYYRYSYTDLEVCRCDLDREVDIGEGATQTRREWVRERAKTGKAKVSDVRLLAGIVLAMEREVKRLRAELERQIGGEPVKVEVPAEEARLWTPHVPKLRSPMVYHDAGGFGQPDANDRVSCGRVRVEHHQSSSPWILHGPAQWVDNHRQLVRALNRAVQRAYEAGLAQGRNLLLGLTAGTLSLQEFNEVTQTPPEKEA